MTDPDNLDSHLPEAGAPASTRLSRRELAGSPVTATFRHNPIQNDNGCLVTPHPWLEPDGQFSRG